jgi:hypothetical protein
MNACHVYLQLQSPPDLLHVSCSTRGSKTKFFQELRSHHPIAMGGTACATTTMALEEPYQQSPPPFDIIAEIRGTRTEAINRSLLGPLQSKSVPGGPGPTPRAILLQNRISMSSSNRKVLQKCDV